MNPVHVAQPQNSRVDRSNRLVHNGRRHCNAGQVKIMVAALLAAGSVMTVAPLDTVVAAETTKQTNTKQTETKQTATVQMVQGPTQRVVVQPFDPPGGNTTFTRWNTIGDEIADMMITALVERGVDVLERRTMANQEREKELQIDGTVDQSTASEFGKVLGGQVMLVGRISEFGVEEKGAGIGGRLLGGVLGGIGKQKKTARVKLDGRLIDIRTNRILGVATGEGTESNGGFNLSGGSLFGWLGGVDFKSGEWLESQLGKATRKAVDNVIAKLVAKIPSATAVAAGVASSVASSVTNEPSPQATAKLIADDMPGLPALRKMTCVVLIPEVHLARPHIPDPAAETEITRQLLRAGIKVKDDQRLRELREEKWVREAGLGQLDAAKLADLRTRFGADILIVGEGITERVEKEQMQRQSVFCRGRVEVKAIRMDTGAIIAAEAEHSPGRDASEILASKAALQAAGGALAPRLIESMAGNLAHGAASPDVETVTMELEIKGFSSLKEANLFLTTLGKMGEVKAAEQQGWRGGVLFATVEVAKAAARRVGLWMEAEEALARFHIQVEDSSLVKVQGVVRNAGTQKS